MLLPKLQTLLTCDGERYLFMDIEGLKKKRQLNVQEQNALKEHGILYEAKYWRTKGLPDALKLFLESKGINTSRCIVLDYNQDFPGCSTDFGKILTEDSRFYRFDMDMTPNRMEIIELYEWQDITALTDISKSKPGTGATWGYLALKTLKELNE